MTVELAVIVALPLVLTAFGVSVGLSLLASGLIGMAVLTDASKLAAYAGSTVTGTLMSYVAVAAILLILVGALLDHVGAVLGLPGRPAGTRADPDRAPWFAGGALGVPLPVAASVVFIGLVTETSIGRLTVAALLPGLALSALYLLLFGLSRLVRPATLELGGEPQDAQPPGPGALAIVFRCIVPVVCALVFIAPIHAGVLTPTGAAGLMGVIALVFVLTLILVSRRAQAGAWPGLAAGAAGAARFLLIVLGLVVFAQVLALGRVPQTLATAIAPLGLDGRGLLALAAVAALVVGTVLGPVAAVGLAGSVSLALVAGAGVNRLVFGVTLFLAAEAVRVGPRLWRGGFLREGPGGGLGSWPNYLAAVAVTAAYIVLFG